jgi:HisA/HisF family protein
MKLIPVMDLMRGQVVRAVRGDRLAYQPIVSQLCSGSDPVTMAAALCEHCATSQLYVADLDALLGQPVQIDVLKSVLQALPDLELWLDAGFANADAAATLRQRLGSDGQRIVPVFGSESLASRSELERCFAGTDASIHDAVLSLDRRDGKRLDAAGCWEAPELWPARLIVMTLERVGSDAGPDLQTLAEVRSRSPQTFIVGAGGIRNSDDLTLAEQAGAGAWLVASALHDGRLPRVSPRVSPSPLAPSR